MASVVTTSTDIVAVARFKDEDTRTLTIPNPKADISSEEIQAFQTASQEVLIGDKTGADFVEFATMKRRTVVKTETTY